MSKRALPDVKIFNNTALEVVAIRALPLVGVIENRWRQRLVELYQDPDDSTMLFMYGVSFGQCEIVVTHERAGMDEHVAMDYWKHGHKTLVRE